MLKKSEIYFGLKVDDLEKIIKVETQKITEKAITDVGLAVKQGLKSINLILKEITAGFNVVKELVKKRLEPEVEKITEEISQANFEEFKTEIKDKVIENEKKIGSIDVDLKRTKLSYNWRDYKFIIIAIISLNSIDAIVNFASLQVIVKNLLLSLIVALAVGISLSWGTHVIGHKIRFAITIKEKAIWIIFTIIGASLLFYFLGLQRREFTQDQGTGLFNSPILWMLFCDFFFVIALLLSITKLPTKEQVLERNEMKDKEEEIDSIKRENEILMKNLEKVEFSYNQAKQNLEVFKKYQESLLNSIDKEVELLHSTCEKEFELKIGKVLLNKTDGNE
jgi:D-ribose pyranose/furanose isomerase RbsD